MAETPRKISEALTNKLVEFSDSTGETSTHLRNVDQHDQLLGFASTSMKSTSSQTSSRSSYGVDFSFPKKRKDPGDSTGREGEC